tara:strand:- start:272 stop:403 length:132 start_codon:yes stop_codon:yes gene_type:complete
MTDKELQEWEEEAKEADESIKNILFYGTIALVYILMLYAMIKL